MNRVRHHSDAEVDTLLDWCDTSAPTKPGQVVAVGLAYVHGLNAHQIASAVLVSTEIPVTIEYPLARRAAEIPGAARATTVLDEPAWLAVAAGALASEAERLAPGTLLYRTRRRVSVPLAPGYIRNLVGTAGRAAGGTRMSCETLNQTRIAAVRRAGLPFALFGSGYADSWAARLTAAPLALRLPRRAA